MAAGGALHLGAGGVGESELIWRLFREVEIAAARRSHVCKAEWVDGSETGSINDVRSPHCESGRGVERKVAWTPKGECDKVRQYQVLETSFMKSPFIETHEKGNVSCYF